jgi:hypothetical protein
VRKNIERLAKGFSLHVLKAGQADMWADAHVSHDRADLPL